jgi:hypothetical protein
MMGFSRIVHLSPQATRERYFVGRHDGLDEVGRAIQLMHAII